MAKNKKMILRFKENDDDSVNKIRVEISEKDASHFCKESPYLCTSKQGTLIVKENFFVNKKVPDKWRYNLKYNNGWQLTRPPTGSVISPPTLSGDFHLHDLDIPETNETPVILVILESPHKYEYSDNAFTPLSPANGDTGTNFEMYFVSHVFPILKSIGLPISKEHEYKIYFVNPVPYQTSLDKIHGKGAQDSLRNKVWKALYPKCQSEFEDRIKRYNPKIILNGCTSDLKDTVQITINSCFNISNSIPKSVDIFKISHPSCWQQSLGAFTQ